MWWCKPVHSHLVLPGEELPRVGKTQTDAVVGTERCWGVLVACPGTLTTYIWCALMIIPKNNLPKSLKI